MSENSKARKSAREKLRVLFVCHGNICRSPMAEFVFKDAAKKAGLGAEVYFVRGKGCAKNLESRLRQFRPNRGYGQEQSREHFAYNCGRPAGENKNAFGVCRTPECRSRRPVVYGRFRRDVCRCFGGVRGHTCAVFRVAVVLVAGFLCLYRKNALPLWGRFFRMCFVCRGFCGVC